MSRPKKADIREWMKRARHDLIGLNQAITIDNAHRIKTFATDLLNSVEEIVGLSEERYDITIDCDAPTEPEVIEGEFVEEGLEDGDEEFEEDDAE